jgi:hypothetical protein
MAVGILNLLLNLFIAGLLMATISYCWVLNKRIKILQDSKSELANLLNHFDDATYRASESIIALQSVSKKIGENINARIDKVNYLMDDLAFMVEKGNKLADQLEANFAVNRARSRIKETVEADEEDSEFIEKPLEKPALKPVPVLEREARVAAQKTVEKPLKAKSGVSLESVLERVVGRMKSTAAPAPAAVNRSKAEQELLDMIRAGIKG